MLSADALSLLQDLTFTSYPVAHFNCLVLFLTNPLLLAYPSVALAGAPDQITELATSYNLIPRATPRTGRPPVEAATAHRWGMAVTVPAAT
jgi:hypothetical protein